MPKVDISQEDLDLAREGLEMAMKSCRRSIQSVGPGDIARAYEAKLAKLAAADSRFSTLLVK